MAETEKMAPQAPKKRSVSPVRWLFGLLFWVGVPLALGIWLSRWWMPLPQVGLIRLNTDIYGFSAEFITQQIDEARNDPRTKAVVVQIDSPGGEVAATQTIYMNLLDLRETMPVVGSIDSIAASGAYYSAMATDPLYAKPSSTVGNVGVWGYYPPTIGVNDTVLASGPFKLTASNSAEFEREIEGVKREFLEVVRSQRGEKLVVTIEALSQGLAYPGRTARELGLVDDLASLTDALDKAAEMAGVKDYEMVDLEARVIEKYYEGYNPYYAWYGATDPKSGERSLLPGLYLLYDVRLGSTR